MKIYITRHSKTIWNHEHRLQGSQDSPLLKQGIEDALLLKQRLSTIPIDVCYSSPLGRAKQTSQLLFDETKIIYDDSLKEMNFGDYEGFFVKDLLEKQEYINLWNNPTKDTKLPNGETYQEVITRLYAFFDNIYKKHADDTIFLTIHGMLFIILRGLMSQLEVEQLPSINTVIRGCSLSYVEYDGHTFTIHYLGEDSHLPKETHTISYSK